MASQLNFILNHSESLLRYARSYPEESLIQGHFACDQHLSRNYQLAPRITSLQSQIREYLQLNEGLDQRLRGPLTHAIPKLGKLVSDPARQTIGQFSELLYCVRDTAHEIQRIRPVAPPLPHLEASEENDEEDWETYEEEETPQTDKKTQDEEIFSRRSSELAQMDELVQTLEKRPIWKEAFDEAEPRVFEILKALLEAKKMQISLEGCIEEGEKDLQQLDCSSWWIPLKQEGYRDSLLKDRMIYLSLERAELTRELPHLQTGLQSGDRTNFFARFEKALEVRHETFIQNALFQREIPIEDLSPILCLIAKSGRIDLVDSILLLRTDIPDEVYWDALKESRDGSPMQKKLLDRFANRSLGSRDELLMFVCFNEMERAVAYLLSAEYSPLSPRFNDEAIHVAFDHMVAFGTYKCIDLFIQGKWVDVDRGNAYLIQLLEEELDWRILQPHFAAIFSAPFFTELSHEQLLTHLKALLEKDQPEFVESLLNSPQGEKISQIDLEARLLDAAVHPKVIEKLLRHPRYQNFSPDFRINLFKFAVQSDYTSLLSRSLDRLDLRRVSHRDLNQALYLLLDDSNELDARTIAAKLKGSGLNTDLLEEQLVQFAKNGREEAVIFLSSEFESEMTRDLLETAHQAAKEAGHVTIEYWLWDILRNHHLMPPAAAAKRRRHEKRT
jgi:hypothetical protein